MGGSRPPPPPPRRSRTGSRRGAGMPTVPSFTKVSACGARSLRAPSDFLLRQRDRSDHRGQEQDRRELEGEQVIGEQRPSYGLDGSGVRGGGPRHPGAADDQRGLEDEEPRDDAPP